jgi:D-arabinose 1-dehydrogenase-like Zn-dependent alcohol dehydrogenase
MMRAALVEAFGQPLVVQDVPVPRPGPGEVLVEVRAAGVCFTDIKVRDGLGARVPLIPGHETAGVVAAAGEGARARPGEAVAVHAVSACGRCEACAAGLEQACVRGLGSLAGIGHDGGYAQYMTAPAASLVPLPGGMDPVTAAPLLCAGLTSFSGLRNGGLQPGMRAAAIGIGGLGHLAVQIAAAMGAQVYAVTGSPDKAATALGLGAVFAGDAAAAAAALRDVGGAHVILNTAETLDAAAALVPSMAMRGSLVLAAGTGSALPVTPDQLMAKQLRVVGTFFGSRGDLRDLLRLAARHHIAPLVERYPLTAVNTVHDRLQAGKVRYRAILEP